MIDLTVWFCPVYTYPDIFESATFSFRIQKFPRPHVAYSNRIQTGWKIKRVYHESVESSRICLFVKGDQHHTKNPPQFRPIASKNNTTALQYVPQFLKVGTVYKGGLKVGVKVCLNYSHSCLCREIPECVGYVTLIVEC